jgi:hypothetical protein
MRLAKTLIVWLAVFPLAACHGMAGREQVCPAITADEARYGRERVITRLYQLPNDAPIFDPAGARWQDAIRLIQTVIAPGDWQSAFHLGGSERTLVVRTTPSNHLAIGDALPRLFPAP